MLSFLASLFVLASREGVKFFEYGYSHRFRLPKIFNYLLAYTYVKIGTIPLQANFVASFDFVLVIVVLLVACIGKVLGVMFGLKISKMLWRQSAVIGFALNSRGAMEMILATVARDAGLIDDRLFVALVIMALVTSIITGPIISRLNVSNFSIAEAL
jgi:hypothetical protein